MIKDIFELNKNGWYVRLVKWMWQVDYKDFTHMCPFFWLCVGSVLILPLFIPFLGLYFIFGKVIKVIVKGVDFFIEKRRKKEQLQEDKLLTVAREYADKLSRDPILLKDFTQKIMKWENYTYKLTPFERAVWYSLPTELYGKVQLTKKDVQIENFLAKEEEIKKQREANRLAMELLKARKDKINHILKVLKPVTKVLLYVLSFSIVIGAVYWLIRSFKWLLSIEVKIWSTFGSALGSVIIVIFVSYLIYKLLNLATDKITTSEKSKFLTDQILDFGERFIAKPIIYVFKGIVKITAIIIMAFKNECPAIKWKD